MELAPIVLFVYNRPEHTRACLEYLERNELAAESELYVFADGAKSGSEEAVAAVRRVIAEPWKFKRLNVVERPENKGLAANNNNCAFTAFAIGWVMRPISCPGSVIFEGRSLYASSSRLEI